MSETPYEYVNSWLRKNDPEVPRCQKPVEDFDYVRGECVVEYSPCALPEGHEGYCSTFIAPLDFYTVSALVEEFERLREQLSDFKDDFLRTVREQCAPDEVHCSCVPHLREENRILQNWLKSPRQNRKSILGAFLAPLPLPAGNLLVYDKDPDVVAAVIGESDEFGESDE